MKPKFRLTLRLAALTGLTVAFTSATLHAQTAWDGGPDGTGTDYATAANWAGDIVPGDSNLSGAFIGSSASHTVVYSTATSYTSTGTAVANSLRVGTGINGVGNLTLSGSAGTLTFGGDGYNAAAWIGTTATNTAATGTVTVSAGNLAITGGTDASINLGVSTDATLGAKSGTLIINGGTVDVGRRILMGANSNAATGVLTISSGTLDMKRTGLASEGDLGMIRLSIGNNTVNLDGGTVIFSGFHTNTTGASSTRSAIYMNGTTLKANATIADLFNGTTAHTSLRLKNGGLVVDTNTFNVTVNDALTQETGHIALLRKEGEGTLTITGSQASRTGTTTVNGGTLRVQTNGTLGTGATTVSGSTSILDLNRNDIWGGHAGSAQALTIQSGALVTNGTLTNRGFNAVQTLALDGGELRVTGTARAIADGDLYKFEAYGIGNSVTVTGTSASSITNPTLIPNAGINIGGYTDLGGGIGSDLTFNVADVTGSSAADLTVSAVLKNNYGVTAFNPLTNGLVKTGDGTLLLSAVNRYTGKTTVEQGTLSLVEASLADGAAVEISATATLDLQFGATDTIDKLFINGVEQAAGTWGADGNLAADHTSLRITGSGLLNVTPPPPAGYAGWAAGFLPAFTNTAANLDFENDGLASGIEWVVGGDPTLNDAAAVTPTFNNTTDPANFLFTFRRRDSAASDPNTTIIVQYGSDLINWTTAQDGISGVSIDATTDLGGGFHQVTVSIPRTLAADGKLFARLNVVVAP